MAVGPICNAINSQFDAWDAQIEDLKNKSKEAAMEQAEKIKKDIQDYAEKKGEELEKQATETEAKEQALAVPTPPKDIDDVVGFCSKVVTCLQEMVSMIATTVVDTAAAPAVLSTRVAQSLEKLANI